MPRQKNTAAQAQNTVLILQGGGALGAYQAGVYEQMLAHDFPLDWVIGTSIGAINSAIIAGNTPENRMKNLCAFWQGMAPKISPVEGMLSMFAPWAAAENAMNLTHTIVHGIDGFFTPRMGAGWDMNAPVTLAQSGFYDTSPLKTTLEKYVDFDYLNRDGGIRLSVCAVDIDTGQSAIFDSKKQTICAEHIMASGALPPGFPAVEIDGRAYWDGGIYSNSPLDVFLREEKGTDALCFMVDLWDPSEPRPTTMAEVLSRYKCIQYASRSKDLLATEKKLQAMRRAIQILSDKLPKAAKEDPDLQAMINMGSDRTVNVVHMVMKALPGDESFKDVDFSAETVAARWAAGMSDCARAFRHKSWLKPLPPHAGMMTHHLPQD